MPNPFPGFIFLKSMASSRPLINTCVLSFSLLHSMKTGLFPLSLYHSVPSTWVRGLAYPLVNLDPQQGSGPREGAMIVSTTLRSFSQGPKENFRAEPSPGGIGGEGVAACTGSCSWLSGSSQEQPKKEEKHSCPTELLQGGLHWLTGDQSGDCKHSL